MAVVLQRSPGVANIKNLSWSAKGNPLVLCWRLSSSVEAGKDEVKPLKTAKLTAFKRGTGGRSSFNGIVATVFGCSGFMGRFVTNKLGKQGTQVILPYRGDYYKTRPLKLAGDLGQIQFMNFHLNDEESIRKAMKYSNVVVNLIGRDNSTWNFSLDDVHVKGARRLARLAREAGVERFIHFSAISAAENPTPVILPNGSEFLKSKYRGELAVFEEFPQATIFRPSDIFGTNDHYLHYYAGMWRRTFNRLALSKKGVGVIKQPVYAGDVAKGVVNAIFDPNSAGKIYQAVGPTRYELSELIDWFYRVMRKDLDYNFKRVELKYDVLFRLRVALTEWIMKVKPVVCWERIEREHVSDLVSSDLPTLEDLGVDLNPIENHAPIELFVHRRHNDYDDALGEFDDPVPPRVYNPPVL